MRALLAFGVLVVANGGDMRRGRRRARSRSSCTMSTRPRRAGTWPSSRAAGTTTTPSSTASSRCARSLQRGSTGVESGADNASPTTGLYDPGRRPDGHGARRRVRLWVSAALYSSVLESNCLTLACCAGGRSAKFDDEIIKELKHTGAGVVSMVRARFKTPYLQGHWLLWLTRNVTHRRTRGRIRTAASSSSRWRRRRGWTVRISAGVN